MNTWILSLILCSAAPAPDGSYCQAKPLEVGITRQECQAALASRRADSPGSRVECTNDPALVTVLKQEAVREEARQKNSRKPKRAEANNEI